MRPEALPRTVPALVIVLLCAGVPTARANAPAAAPAAGEPYGLVAFNANFIPGQTVADRTAAYRRLYEAGVRAVRIGMDWTSIQPIGSAHDHFDFRERDREVAAVRAAGLKVIGILGLGNPDYSTKGKLVAQTPPPVSGGAPPFGVGNAEYFPPDDPADFARYARATARHYARDAIAWEVWNEENQGYRFWPPREDPAAYARMLCAAYPEIKATAPQADVLYGGVFYPSASDGAWMSGPSYLQATYDANPRLGRCFDAMAYHPYPYPFTAPELDVPVRGSVLAAADSLRAVLARNGDAAKPLWITEIGWPTHERTYGVPEAKQAQYVARLQAATFAQGVPVLTWYTYGDGADPTGGANQEAWFGFFRADGSPKPAVAALHTFSTVFAGARFSADRSRALGLPPGEQNLGGRGFALEYRRAGATVTAVWLASESAGEGQSAAPPGGSARPASVPVTVPVAARSVTVVDYLGARRTLAAPGGKVTLQAGPGPQYVIDPVPDAAGSALPGTAGLVLAPAARCASRRRFVVHLHPRRGLRVRRLTVYVNGRRVRSAGPAVLRSPIDLRGLPRGTVRVRLVLEVQATVRGHPRLLRLVGERRYLTCRPGGHRPRRTAHPPGRAGHRSGRTG